MKFLRAIYNRVRWRLFGRRTRSTRGQHEALIANLRAEGFMIVWCRCGRCGKVEQCAIFPKNLFAKSECGRCHYMESDVVEVIEED